MSIIYRIFPFSWRAYFFHHSNFLPSRLGYLQRYLLAKSLLKSCGKNIRIEPNVIIKDIENVSIGDNVSINAFSYIIGSGGVTIGNNVSIAHSSSIVAESHTWEELNVPICYNPIIPTPVSIHDDVWIGCGVRIIGPCIIHNRTIVAAGTIVKGELQPNAIYAGPGIGKLIKFLSTI